MPTPATMQINADTCECGPKQRSSLPARLLRAAQTAVNVKLCAAHRPHHKCCGVHLSPPQHKYLTLHRQTGSWHETPQQALNAQPNHTLLWLQLAGCLRRRHKPEQGSHTPTTLPQMFSAIPTTCPPTHHAPAVSNTSQLSNRLA